jgi:hypothetical protein
MGAVTTKSKVSQEPVPRARRCERSTPIGNSGKAEVYDVECDIAEPIIPVPQRRCDIADPITILPVQCDIAEPIILCEIDDCEQPDVCYDKTSNFSLLFNLLDVPRRNSKAC